MGRFRVSACTLQHGEVTYDSLFRLAPALRGIR